MNTPAADSYDLVPRSLTNALRAWMEQGEALFAQLGQPISIANITTAPPLAPARTAEAAPARLSRPARTVTAHHERDGLRTDAQGKYLIQRGVQSYTDVGWKVLPDTEDFDLATAWAILAPTLADPPARGDEYLRRRLNRDARFLKVQGDPERWRKRRPDDPPADVLVDVV